MNTAVYNQGLIDMLEKIKDILKFKQLRKGIAEYPRGLADDLTMTLAEKSQKAQGPVGDILGGGAKSLGAYGGIGAAAGAGGYGLSQLYNNEDTEVNKESYEQGFTEVMEKASKVLTTKGRKHIKEKNFAIPGKKKYPIHDEAHARNALARVSQFGTAAEKKQVRAAVHAKYPNIGEKKEADVNKEAYEQGFLDTMEKAGARGDFLVKLLNKAEDTISRARAAGVTSRGIQDNILPSSVQDLRRFLETPKDMITTDRYNLDKYLRYGDVREPGLFGTTFDDVGQLLSKGKQVDPGSAGLRAQQDAVSELAGIGRTIKSLNPLLENRIGELRAANSMRDRLLSALK